MATASAADAAEADEAVAAENEVDEAGVAELEPKAVPDDIFEAASADNDGNDDADGLLLAVPVAARRENAEVECCEACEACDADNDPAGEADNECVDWLPPPIVVVATVE